jgi:hypothetical protein
VAARKGELCKRPVAERFGVERNVDCGRANRFSLHFDAWECPLSRRLKVRNRSVLPITISPDSAHV